jgi:hypothetical protein
MACFQHGGRSDVRGSALMIGQHVRVLITGLWLPRTIESVFATPDSYIVRLDDGLVFRRTCRDINCNTPKYGNVTPIAVSRGQLKYSHPGTNKVIKLSPLIIFLFQC